MDPRAVTNAVTNGDQNGTALEYVYARGSGWQDRGTMFHFTRQGATWAVTVPCGDAWRLLDGSISVHVGGHVVCCDMHEAVDLAALLGAWRAWWAAQYEN